MILPAWMEEVVGREHLAGALLPFGDEALFLDAVVRESGGQPGCESNLDSEETEAPKIFALYEVTPEDCRGHFPEGAIFPIHLLLEFAMQATFACALVGTEQKLGDIWKKNVIALAQGKISIQTPRKVLKPGDIIAGTPSSMFLKSKREGEAKTALYRLEKESLERISHCEFGFALVTRRVFSKLFNI